MTIRLNKLSRQLMIASGLALLSTTGAHAASANANAGATIIRPITITSDANLAFGNVVAAVGAGTVLIDPAAVPTPVLGSVTRPGSQVGTIAAAHFNVGGEGSFTYTITLPVGAVNLSCASCGGAPDMTVDTWTSSIATTAGAGLLSGAAGTAGTQGFYVGGTMHVGATATQTAAVYAGVFAVSVDYN